MLEYYGDSELVQRDHGGPAEAQRLGPTTSVEVSSGQRHFPVVGLGLGALAGFGVGMVTAGQLGGCSGGIFGGDLCGLYGVIAVPAGAVVGGVIGRLIAAERWRRVAPRESALRVIPGPHGLILSLTAPF